MESDAATRDRVTFRLSGHARSALEAIKRAYDLKTDGEAIRIALGTELRMAQAAERGEHVYISDPAQKQLKELVFGHWPPR